MDRWFFCESSFFIGVDYLHKQKHCNQMTKEMHTGSEQGFYFVTLESK